MKVMVIESKVDELIPERYKEQVMNGSHRITHWQTIEVSAADYERYEELRIELSELIDELRGDN